MAPRTSSTSNTSTMSTDDAFDPFSASRESTGSWMNFSDAFGEQTEFVAPDIVDKTGAAADKKKTKKKDKKSSKKESPEKDKKDKKKKSKSKEKDGASKSSEPSSSTTPSADETKSSSKKTEKPTKKSKSSSDKATTKKKKKVKELTKDEAQAALMSPEGSAKVVKKVVRRKKKKSVTSGTDTAAASSSQQTNSQPKEPISPKANGAVTGKVVLTTTPTSKKKKKSKSLDAGKSEATPKLSDKIKAAQTSQSMIVPPSNTFDSTEETKLPAWKLRELAKEKTEKPKRHSIEVEDTAKNALKLVGNRGAPPRKSQFGYYATTPTSSKPSMSAASTRTPTSNSNNKVPSMFATPTSSSGLKPSLADSQSSKTPRRMLKKEVGLGDHFGTKEPAKQQEMDAVSASEGTRARSRRQYRRDLENELGVSGHGPSGAASVGGAPRGRSIPRRRQRGASSTVNSNDTNDTLSTDDDLGASIHSMGISVTADGQSRRRTRSADRPRRNLSADGRRGRRNRNYSSDDGTTDDDDEDSIVLERANANREKINKFRQAAGDRVRREKSYQHQEEEAAQALAESQSQLQNAPDISITTNQDTGHEVDMSSVSESEGADFQSPVPASNTERNVGEADSIQETPKGSPNQAPKKRMSAWELREQQKIQGNTPKRNSIEVPDSTGGFGASRRRMPRKRDSNMERHMAVLEKNDMDSSSHHGGRGRDPLNLSGHGRPRQRNSMGNVGSSDPMGGSTHRRSTVNMATGELVPQTPRRAQKPVSQLPVPKSAKAAIYGRSSSMPEANDRVGALPPAFQDIAKVPQTPRDRRLSRAKLAQRESVASARRGDVKANLFEALGHDSDDNINFFCSPGENKAKSTIGRSLNSPQTVGVGTKKQSVVSKEAKLEVTEDGKTRMVFELGDVPANFKPGQRISMSALPQTPDM